MIERRVRAVGGGIGVRERSEVRRVKFQLEGGRRVGVGSVLKKSRRYSGVLEGVEGLVDDGDRDARLLSDDEEIPLDFCQLSFLRLQPFLQPERLLNLCIPESLVVIYLLLQPVLVPPRLDSQSSHLLSLLFVLILHVKVAVSEVLNLLHRVRSC